MSARRALAEDFDIAGGSVRDGIADVDRPARRALVEDACRAVIAAGQPVVAPSSYPCARRGLIEDVVEPSVATTQVLPAIEAAAFVAPVRRRFSARQLLAGLSLIAVVGTFSGSAISGSAASDTTPSHSIQATDRQTPISRDAERELAAVAAQAEADAVRELEAQQAAFLDETRAAAEQVALEQAAAERAAEAAAAFAASPSTNIAPGQKPAATVDEAIAAARAKTGSWGYENMCLSLVASFYGYSTAGTVGAQQAANTIIAAGQMNYDMSNIPVGALIWYDGTPIGNPYGHVAMYAGDGMVYSNGAPTGVGLIPLQEPATGWGEPIIGWSTVWLPAATK